MTAKDNLFEAVAFLRPLLTGDPNQIDGYPLSDVRAYSARMNGEYLFAMETPQGRGLFKVKDGVGSVVVEPSRFPAGVPSKGAGGKYVMLGTGSIGAPLNEVWALLKPTLLTPSIIGRAATELSLPCVDCLPAPALNYEVSVAGKILPAASNGSEIRFTIPLGLVGTHPAIVRISGLELPFEIRISVPTPTTPGPTIAGLSGLDQVAASRAAPLHVLQIFGSHLCSESSPAPGETNRARAIPLPLHLAGCQIRIRNRGQAQWLPVPLYFAWTGATPDAASQMNFLVPGEVSEGPGELVVDRLRGDGNQIEASSAPFSIDFVHALPTLFKNEQGYPVIYNATKGSCVSGENPVYAGDILSVIFTGGGRTRPQAQTGHSSTGEITAPVEVKLSDIASEILYAGAQGTPGLYQVNFRAPLLRNVETPLVQLKITIGASSQAVAVNYSVE